MKISFTAKSVAPDGTAVEFSASSEVGSVVPRETLDILWNDMYQTTTGALADAIGPPPDDGDDGPEQGVPTFFMPN